MRILGIDTAATFASVAIVENDLLVAQRCYPEKGSGQAKSNHAEVILPLLGRVLDEAGVAAADIDRIAVSIGPGSFTGVRIGLSTAKGFAFGCGIPVVGISTLMAYATAVSGFECVCPLLDARKKEVYAALFRCEAGKIQRLTEDLVAPVAGIVQQIAQRGASTCALIGSGAQLYGRAIQDELGAHIALVEEPADFTVAAAVARLASGAGDTDTLNIAELIPAYVRSSEAESKRPSAANLSN
ncbi:MAG: tRNA (adenosine(37)-N6)-threonylcarbamoyltransferase complex dimerization subunit type 1 TsaB [Deltaproteobacteria bacterium]|nr:tRNA (adenosine(37)-N6)-threonylcarbamoyltransferase complex dimerization subunit type 1 TsaB [Deltaproteobacteria bacterium]